MTLKLFTDQLKVSVTTINTLGKGQTAVIVANASGVGQLSYSWRKRGFDKLPDKVLDKDTHQLKIPKLNISDEGQYYCIVTNVWNRSVESNDVTLRIYGMLV